MSGKKVYETFKEWEDRIKSYSETVNPYNLENDPRPNPKPFLDPNVRPYVKLGWLFLYAGDRIRGDSRETAGIEEVPCTKASKNNRAI